MPLLPDSHMYFPIRDLCIKELPLNQGSEPQRSTQWASKGGPLPQSQDISSIDHKDNRAFENIRAHQISSIFSLEKHLVDCEKGALERNSTPAPLRGPGGEYSPCQTELTVSQADDGLWFYEYSELPGLVSMKYGMKSFEYNRADPLYHAPPKGPHKNLVRQIIPPEKSLLFCCHFHFLRIGDH